MVKMPKFHLNAHNFDWFLGRPHFSLFLVITSFPATWFSNLHTFWNLPKAISLQSFNALDCLDQVLRRDYKNTMRCHYEVISYFWDSKFLNVVKLIISYQLAKFQIPQLSESNFTEVSITGSKITCKF